MVETNWRVRLTEARGRAEYTSTSAFVSSGLCSAFFPPLSSHSMSPAHAPPRRPFASSPRPWTRRLSSFLVDPRVPSGADLGSHQRGCAGRSTSRRLIRQRILARRHPWHDVTHTLSALLLLSFLRADGTHVP
jgi:hypothetical protein